MGLATTALGIVADAALGAWLGTMAFFSFLGAPRAFAVLGEERAGAYVNDVFPRYYVLGVALGLLATGCLLWGGLLAALGAPTLAAVAATAVAVLAHGYARWILVPRMDAAGDEAFERYHRRSVALNGVAMVAVAAALVAADL